MSDIAAILADSAQQLTEAGAPYELSEQSIEGINYRLYTQAPATMKELLDAGRVHGDATFLVYEDEQWSFTRFYQQVDAIAYQLVNRYGVKKGARIAIAMRNFPEWMSVYTAVASLGAVVVPLNSWGQKEELEYGLSDSGAAIVFCDQRRFEHIAGDLVDLGIKAVVVRSESAIKADGAESFEDFLDNTYGVTLPVFEVNSEDPVMIMYTSGTTGKPKGAVSSHRNIVQAVYNFEFHGINSAMANPKAIEAMFASGNPPTSLLAVPLFHVSGCYAMFLLSLRGGRRIVMMYKWDPLEALQLIEQHKITTLSAVPTMVMDALGHEKFDQYDTSSLIAIGGGGAAPPPLFAELAHSKIDNAYTGTGYGMTENNASCANCTGEAFRYKPTSAGTLSPIVDFKTCNEEGVELPRGERGEIWMRSPTVVQGYWNRPEDNAKTFVDGWLATGDIGYIDDENFVFIVDRAKDIVIRGGENISAAEIEGRLHDHPAVWEVAAIGLPHEKLGEELAVVLNFKPGKTATADELQTFVADQLAGFKVPSQVFITEQPLPRNATGKLLKKDLKEQYRSHTA
jgi:long-chain acyl-CoA synthetase